MKQISHVPNNNDSPCPNCGHCPTCGRANAQPSFVPYPWGYFPTYPWYTPTWINWGVTSLGTVAAAAGNANSTYTYGISAS